MPPKEFNIAIVGNAGVGKTTYLRRFVTGQFEPEYFPTKGVEVVSMPIQTNRGPIIFNVFENNNDNIHTVDAAIVMVSYSDRESFVQMKRWLDLTKTVPIIICGNKCDTSKRQVRQTEVRSFVGYSNYFDISAKTNYNSEKPWLYLARTLTGDSGITFAESPYYPPPTL